MTDTPASHFKILTLLSDASKLSYSMDPLQARSALKEAMASCGIENFDLIAPICDAIRFSMLANHVSVSKKPRPVNKSATVYFAQRADGLIKIGFTSNVRERMNQLSPVAGSALTVLATTIGGSKEEGRLHKRFAAFHCHGEWFHPAPEILEHVARLAASGE